MRHVLKIGQLSLAALLASGVALAPEAGRVPQAGGQRPQPAPTGPAGQGRAAGCRARPSRRPKIEIAQETKEMGTVPKGQVIETDFMIKNTGGSDLVITDARPSCGCTVSSFDKLIKPGAEGKVHTSVDTKSFSGPISKSVLVVSNDPGPPADEPLRQGAREAVRRRRPAGVRPLLGRQGRHGLAGRRPDLRGEGLQAGRRRDGAALRQGRGLARPATRTRSPGRPGEQYKLAISVTAGRARGPPERAGPHHDGRLAAAHARDPGLRHRAPARLGHADHGQLRQLHRRQGSHHAQHRRDEQQAGQLRSRSPRPRSACPAS